MGIGGFEGRGVGRDGGEGNVGVDGEGWGIARF